MKNKIKTILYVFSFLSIALFSMPIMASQVDNYNISNIENEIQPRTDIKEWVFKVENGNLYKRLYNYSTGHWETDWIFVMSGVIEP